MTDDDRLEAITRAAEHFRRVLERRTLGNFSVALADFPIGSCGDAALLLGTYLNEGGLGPCRYVVGEREADNLNGSRSHAWLEVGNLIVDITGDQFQDGQAPVVVTTCRDWHSTFKPDPDDVEQPADFRAYDPHTVSMLGAAYGAITREFEGDQATRQLGASSSSSGSQPSARSTIRCP